ncbi:MAG: hypothetical protein IKF35_06535 [Solobacterium sp.]|nr:hypothetical protein [Solobacterium sp.]
MNRKIIIYSEFTFLPGLLLLALGTALTEKAALGMSMVVAPAYVIYLFISGIYPWFTFGMAEYLFQALLIVLLSLFLRRLKPGYLFSFMTAVIYGILLDLMMKLTGSLQAGTMPMRLVLFGGGLVLCALGVALLFHTYIPPEAYELIVKELVSAYNLPLARTKTVYDCISAVTAVVLSFLCFGFGTFAGVGPGTIFSAVVNGALIGAFSGLLEKYCDFPDMLGGREFFTS